MSNSTHTPQGDIYLRLSAAHDELAKLYLQLAEPNIAQTVEVTEKLTSLADYEYHPDNRPYSIIMPNQARHGIIAINDVLEHVIRYALKRNMLDPRPRFLHPKAGNKRTHITGTNLYYIQKSCIAVFDSAKRILGEELSAKTFLDVKPPIPAT